MRAAAAWPSAHRARTGAVDHAPMVLAVLGTLR